MTVTVLMAVYNEAGDLERAVRSVRGQTHEDWELLVVDDGSTDGTPLLLERLCAEERRLRVVHNEVNRGLPAALNRGWRQARSELIARLDADDVCLPTRLAAQLRYLNDHPEVAVLGTGAELVDERGALGETFRPEQHEVLVARIYRENPFIHPTVMMRRSFLEATGGYDERLRRAQDYDLWLRGYRSFRYHNLAQALVRHRVSRRPRPSAVVYGTYMLVRAAHREGRLSTHGWYGLRFLAAGLLGSVGIRETRLR